MSRNRSNKSKVGNMKDNFVPSVEMPEEEEKVVVVEKKETYKPEAFADKLEALVETKPFKKESPFVPKTTTNVGIVKPINTSDLEAKLVNYVNGMTLIKDDEGVASIQYSFFTTLRSTLSKKDPEEFRKEWNTILKFANKNKATIFNESNLFRGASMWKGSQVEFTVFRRLCHLIITTADHTTRASSIKTVSLELVTEGLKQLERNHLFNFYG